MCEWVKTTDYSAETKDFILEMTAKYPQQFDNQTIAGNEKFTKLQYGLGVDAQKSADEFGKIIEASSFKHRYGEHRKERLQELFDAQLEDNVKLHAGFSKMCGLEGSNLTPSQIQRISIARSMLKEAKIMVLDGATRNIPANQSNIVVQALERACQGRTSIVIPYSSKALKELEILYIMNAGQIVEVGSYEELTQDSVSYFNQIRAGLDM